ncbi:hypothetical protein SDC9_135527 [bioreactor metagenome]|uniref:Uncharacterized protein n=1 Tax=bioreactor metagenome TaxID=1076179 RepID=A0A645DHX9_9ZZZZ
MRVDLTRRLGPILCRIGGDRGCEAVQEGGDGRLSGGDEAVVHPGAAPLGAEQAGVLQDLQVVGDGGLGDVGEFGEVADAGLAARVGGDGRQHPEPERVGQRLQRVGHGGSDVEADCVRLGRCARLDRCGCFGHGVLLRSVVAVSGA